MRMRSFHFSILVLLFLFNKNSFKFDQDENLIVAFCIRIFDWEHC